MAPEAILAGIGAIITAAGGVVLVIREFRRRDRIAMQKIIDEMSDEISVLHVDLLAFRKFAFTLAQLLADHGIESPVEPKPHHILREK